MTYTQQVHDCPEHDNCHVIICVDTTGATVWASHDANTVDPAGRINPDVPAYDHTGGGDPVPITPVTSQAPQIQK
jgi:hypothetical protein